MTGYEIRRTERNVKGADGECVEGRAEDSASIRKVIKKNKAVLLELFYTGFCTKTRR